MSISKDDLYDAISKLTGKQRSVLEAMCERPLNASSTASLSNVKAEDLSSLGGIIGTLKRTKIENNEAFIKQIMRDDQGNSVYGVNEKVVDRKTLKDALETLLEIK